MVDIKKILIIDDDADFRRLLSTRLKNIYTNAEITEYDILAKNEFPSETECSEHDLLILDHDLRGEQSGVSWFNSCSKGEDFPVTILMTSLGNKSTAMFALNCGVHFYLVKQTITEEILTEAAAKAIETRDVRMKIASKCK